MGTTWLNPNVSFHLWCTLYKYDTPYLFYYTEQNIKHESGKYWQTRDFGYVLFYTIRKLLGVCKYLVQCEYRSEGPQPVAKERV